MAFSIVIFGRFERCGTRRPKSLQPDDGARFRGTGSASVGCATVTDAGNVLTGTGESCHVDWSRANHGIFSFDPSARAWRGKPPSRHAAADEEREMTDTYILDGRNPIPCADFMTGARWFETSDRQVAKTDFGDVRVSTVFLGLDRSFGEGPPLLFETMIFGGPFDQDKYQERCSTWEEAEAQHAEAVEVARQSLNRPGAGVALSDGMPTGVSL
jgi:hypothetical protein